MTDKMEKIGHKIILDVTLLQPFVNKQAAILSKLTFKDKESNKKMKYQRDEKEVFAEAGIILSETVDDRILLSRTVDCNGTILIKITDKQFRAETPKYQTPELANREALNILQIITNYMESNNYTIVNVVKTKCKSGRMELNGQKENMTEWCEI